MSLSSFIPWIYHFSISPKQCRGLIVCVMFSIIVIGL
jgi:hypothetical protein